MQNILYCEQNIDGTIGGSYYSLFYLVTNLDRDKYNPMVVFYRDNEFVPRLKNLGVEAIVMKKENTANFMARNNGTSTIHGVRRVLVGPVQKTVNITRKLFLSAFQKAFFLKKHNISLVHLNNSVVHNQDWMLAARISGIKCITHERGINNKFPMLARYFGQRLNAIICISKAVQDNLYEKTRLTNSLVIYNGLDPADMKVMKERDEVRRQYGIGPDDPVIGIIGNIKAWKGQNVALKALALAREQLKGLKCFFVGDTAEGDRPFAEEVHKLVNELRLENTVIFTGFQKNVADFINAMDVVVHTSVLPEPFGRVILEPMALRKPVIATNIGAPPEIIIEGTTGLLVPPDNPDFLSRAIMTIFGDLPRAKLMGEAGYAQLIDNFSLDRNIRETMKLYERLLG